LRRGSFAEIAKARPPKLYVIADAPLPIVRAKPSNVRQRGA